MPESLPGLDELDQRLSTKLDHADGRTPAVRRGFDETTGVRCGPGHPTMVNRCVASVSSRRVSTVLNRSGLTEGVTRSV